MRSTAQYSTPCDSSLCNTSGAGAHCGLCPLTRCCLWSASILRSLTTRAMPRQVSLVRMSNDNALPLDQRRNYKSVVDAAVRIARCALFLIWPRAPFRRCLVLHLSLAPCDSSWCHNHAYKGS